MLALVKIQPSRLLALRPRLDELSNHPATFVAGNSGDNFAGSRAREAVAIQPHSRVRKIPGSAVHHLYRSRDSTAASRRKSDRLDRRAANRLQPAGVDGAKSDGPGADRIRPTNTPRCPDDARTDAAAAQSGSICRSGKADGRP